MGLCFKSGLSPVKEESLNLENDEGLEIFCLVLFSYVWKYIIIDITGGRKMMV